MHGMSFVAARSRHFCLRSGDDGNSDLHYEDRPKDFAYLLVALTFKMTLSL